MPRTKTTKRARDGASSSAPGSAESDPFVDILGVNWPIRQSEVPNYYDVRVQTHIGTRFLFQDILEDLNFWVPFRNLLQNSGLTSFFTSTKKGYLELMHEFYVTTAKEEGVDALHCRLNGTPIVITPSLLRNVFDLPPSRNTTFPRHININDHVWMSIGGGEAWKTKGGTKSQLIREPVHCIFHKFIAHALFGKNESNKINKLELLILWGAVTSKKYNVARFLFNKLCACTRTIIGQKLIFGHVITAIALHQRVISEAQLETLTPVTGDPIDYETLRAAHIIDHHHNPIPWQNRPIYRALAHGAPPNEPGDASDEEDAGDEDGADVEAQLPDAPPQQAGPSASGTFPMDMMMSQFERLSGQLQDIHGHMQSAHMGFDARLTEMAADIHSIRDRVDAQERHQRRLERHMHYYFCELGNAPPPPPSP